MKKITAFIILIFVCSGCSLFDRFSGGGAAETNSNAEVAKTETETTPAAETTPQTETDVSKQKDFLSIGANAILVKASSEYTPNEINRWSAYGLINESETVGWATEKGKVSNASVVFELPARTTFKTIGFDTEKVDTDGAAAKDVSIEISDVSADSGFETILSTSLKDKTDGQNFPVEKQAAGRWVKINAKNNFGNAEWLEIMEVRGYGEQETPKPFTKNVSGTYDTGRWGKFHIKQEGTSIVGCYEHDGGLLEGGLDGRTMTLTWKEIGETENDFGPAIFLFDDDAKKFTGFWSYSNMDYWNDVWNGEKVSDEVGSCEHFKDLSGENAAGSQIEKELEKDGRATVYGINFDFNSDKIKDESKPTLDQIAGILKDNSGWKMTVEGHTDNIGGESFNQSLSEKRANAVIEYLKTVGIDASRLTAKGLGLSKPVGDNDTEAGRARNRRVELVKQ